MEDRRIAVPDTDAFSHAGPNPQHYDTLSAGGSNRVGA